MASALYLIWNYGYRQGTTGSSIGKAVMKFRVVSEKTWQPIGFIRSLLRQLAHALDAFLCYIGYLLPLWDPQASNPGGQDHVDGVRTGSLTGPD